MLSALGQREEALSAIQEAVELYRGLAQRNPDAFLPNLAGSLNNLGQQLNEMDKSEEALVSFEKALDTLWPFFEDHPLAFMRNTAIMISNVQKTCEALQRPLPLELPKRMLDFRRLTGLGQEPD
jgi:tetratricopeptide (TPR) repeat protein